MSPVAIKDWGRWYRSIANDYVWFLSVCGRFTGETLRQVATERGLEPPTHHNAWSAAAQGQLRQWMEQGWVVFAGYEKSKSPSARGRLVRAYERAW